MTDMGPRRMDGFARPVAGSPSGGQQRPMSRPVAQPQQAASSRPVQSQVQPRVASQRPVVAQPGQRPAQQRASQSQQVASPPMNQPAAAVRRPEAATGASKQGGAWKVVLQFILGILVIVGVAAGIVALYVRYYQ